MDELVKVVARALFANDDKYKGYPWFAVSPTVRDMFLSDAQAAIAAARPAILEEAAKVAEDQGAMLHDSYSMRSRIATAIRAIARGEG